MSPREAIIKNLLKQALKKTYSFTPADDWLDTLSKSIVREINLNEWSTFVKDSRNSFPRRAFFAWFNTTGIPKTEKWKHSAAGFAFWLEKHYLLIPIRRFWRGKHH